MKQKGTYFLCAQLRFLEAKADIQHAIRYAKGSIVLCTGRKLTKAKLKEWWNLANSTLNSEAYPTILSLGHSNLMPFRFVKHKAIPLN